MDIKETLIEHLKIIANLLNENKIDYALAGGLAFSALVEPRATMDIDLLLMIREEELPDFFKVLEEKVESLLPHNEPTRFKLIKIWRVVSLSHNLEIIVDFLIAESKFHENIVKRAIEIDFFQTKLKIVTLEDMILLKICAKRTQDIADLEQIYSTFRNEIDHDYVKYWAGKLNIKLESFMQN